MISRSSGGLISFNKSNRVIFSGEKCKMKLLGVFVFSEYAREKNFQPHLVLESKGL